MRGDFEYSQYRPRVMPSSQSPAVGLGSPAHCKSTSRRCRCRCPVPHHVSTALSLHAITTLRSASSAHPPRAGTPVLLDDYSAASPVPASFPRRHAVCPHPPPRGHAHAPCPRPSNSHPLLRRPVPPPPCRRAASAPPHPSPFTTAVLCPARPVLATPSPRTRLLFAAGASPPARLHAQRALLPRRIRVIFSCNACLARDHVTAGHARVHACPVTASVGRMLIYLVSPPIWNGLLPVYAFWHCDDFSWGQARMLEGGEAGGKGGGVEGDKEGEFDLSRIVIKRWAEFERTRRWKSGTQSRDSDKYFKGKADSNRYSLASNSDQYHPPSAGVDSSRSRRNTLLILPTPLAVSRRTTASSGISSSSSASVGMGRERSSEGGFDHSGNTSAHHLLPSRPW
ncbi:chitin synthase-domain-containing protein [Mycena albidolilacea]|uniref:Chitin synthase-domain-containing protein n=1 Tax=Mycena albidolilacea TaxID=1033008 RepID=A0AAD6ZNY2_9AGAR|nr:chitin synthase-domain-containing protein [Mycena albidolilacea]